MRKESNSLETLCSKDVHDGLDRGVVVELERWILEDRKQAVDDDSLIVLVGRRAGHAESNRHIRNGSRPTRLVHNLVRRSFL